MAKETIKLTAERLEELKAELRHLIDVEQPRNAEELNAARAQGDLSENSDYQYAKERQSTINEQIASLKRKIENAVVINISDLDTSFVQFGSIVTILDLSDNTEEIYSIRGSDEVDIIKNYISTESPLGSALSGHKVGDVVTVKCSEPYDVKILKIEVK